MYCIVHIVNAQILSIHCACQQHHFDLTYYAGSFQFISLFGRDDNVFKKANYIKA